MATIKDVAEKAGITVTTVSRVLNNRGYISDKTREKVYAVMKELDYQPNEIARALVQKNTKQLGIIVPLLLHPFFSACINYFEQYASLYGYKLLVCNALRDDKKELEYIDMLKSNKVSGIILCTRSGHLLDSLRNLPVVTLERAISDQIPNILCDNFQGGILATTELVEKGCKHLAIISGSEEVKLPADERASAFIQVCKEAGLPHHVYGTSEEQFNTGDYRNMIHQIFREHPDIDGIFCTSDVIAAQVLQVCGALKRLVPQEIKVVGFDDVDIASLTYPTLTTIKQPIEEMCKYAVECIVKKIKGETVPIQMVMPVSLIERESTSLK